MPLPQGRVSIANVPVDLATPDKALKSYWAVRDSIRAKRSEMFAAAKEIYRASEVQMGAVSDAALAKTFATDLAEPETFSRDLMDVKVESESRAVIVAVIKNTTPIPAGAEMSKLDEKLRTEGERFRYVLEKSQADWRVSEIWEWSTYPSSGWKKMQPGDGKPRVSSFAYDGI